MEDFLLSILYIVIGLTGGGIVAGGLFSFIVTIGVVTRLVARTRTAKKIKLFEEIVILGGTIGNVYYVFQWQVPLGVLGIVLYGLCSGVFVGCLAISLAEVLQVIPIFANRIKLTMGMSIIVVFLALGKGIGTFLYLMN